MRSNLFPRSHNPRKEMTWQERQEFIRKHVADAQKHSDMLATFGPQHCPVNEEQIELYHEIKLMEDGQI